VKGPFSAQAELVGSQVSSDNNGSLKFYGGYAQLSWYLTGESRPYDRGDGEPGRVVPRSNFGFGLNAGWGSLEAAARLSYTDLSDAAVHGGRLTMFMTSLNWRLRPQLKCMLELGAGRVSDTASSGNIVLAQMRMGVYFY
jgi:phosphate-selective porin OprO/OprP